MPTAGKDTLRAILRRGRELLAQTERPEDCDADFEAFLLLQKVFSVTRGDYPLKADTVPASTLQAEYEALLRRRLAGEPVQYLLGEWEFWGLPFAVGPGVLIPRPETELLAEAALCTLQDVSAPSVLELCGGSGCLAVTLAHERPDAHITTVELSPQALPYLRQNVARNRCPNIRIIEGDALRPAELLLGEGYQLILSNPPYIESTLLPDLQREVQFEPSLALDGGIDGLTFYRQFLTLYPRCLLSGGTMAFEIGETQGAAVAALMREAGLTGVTIFQDLSHLDRVVLGIRP